jgi:hypothetical protein
MTEQNIALFIPSVSVYHTFNTIRKVFVDQHIGIIDHIVFLPLKESSMPIVVHLKTAYMYFPENGHKICVRISEPEWWELCRVKQIKVSNTVQEQLDDLHTIIQQQNETIQDQNQRMNHLLNKIDLLFDASNRR